MDYWDISKCRELGEALSSVPVKDIPRLIIKDDIDASAPDTAALQRINWFLFTEEPDFEAFFTHLTEMEHSSGGPAWKEAIAPILDFVFENLEDKNVLQALKYAQTAFSIKNYYAQAAEHLSQALFVYENSKKAGGGPNPEIEASLLDAHAVTAHAYHLSGNKESAREVAIKAIGLLENVQIISSVPAFNKDSVGTTPKNMSLNYLHTLIVREAQNLLQAEASGQGANLQGNQPG